MSETAIKISKPNKDILSNLPVYDLQIIDTRGAFLENSSGLSSGSYLSHNTRKGIPIALGFRVDSNGNAHAAVGVNIDETTMYLNLSQDTYFRLFYNKVAV